MLHESDEPTVPLRVLKFLARKGATTAGSRRGLSLNSSLAMIVCLLPGLTALAARPRLAARTPPRHAPAQCAFYEGMPSTPGWEGTTLNKLTDWARADTTNRPIICEYKPDTVWLWSKYRGTVLSITTLPVLANMLVGVVTDSECNPAWNGSTHLSLSRACVCVCGRVCVIKA